MAKDKKEKKKKDPKVKVPNAWSSKKSREGGGHNNGLSGSGGKVMTDAIWSVGLVVVGILLILFIFLGGINQRKAITWIVDFSQNIGHKVSSWFNPDNIEINDDGVYYRPDGVKETKDKDEKESKESSETTDASETSESTKVTAKAAAKKKK